MTPTETTLGLDIGTTTSKALLRAAADRPPVVVERATPWRSAGGHTEIAPSALLATALDLVGDAVRAGEDRWGEITVRALSVTGLAESGVLVDPGGRAEVPAIAWFDTRGADDLADLARRHADFAEAFPAVTGLPWSPQASLAKLLWLRGRHPLARGCRWLSVPEWIVHALGGDQVREPSLASRTGLVEQRTGRPWEAALDLVGLPADLLPEAAPAGTPVGKLDHPDAPSAALGALLSVAGHDHPVAALAVDAIGPDQLFNSSGTADVLVRTVGRALTDRERAAVVAAGWSAGAHVVPGATLLLAGGSGGLLLRRVLTALGADTPTSREQLDLASRRLTGLPPGLVVRGDGRTGDDVEIRLRDDATPAAVWAAATAHTAALTREMLAAIAPVVGPHRGAVAAGGWVRMASVRAAKVAALGPLTFSDLEQPGADGAARLAEYSLATERPLGQFVTETRRTTAAPDPEGQS